MSRHIAALLLLCFLSEILTPTVSMALTSGPAQEEFASFEPVHTTDMVDLYSGDFTYNIPLLSVPGPNGGYPINLSYHSGVGMEQEASWVGLGWTLNVGAINRQLRGMPDDFDHDKVEQKMHMKESYEVGLNIEKYEEDKSEFKHGNNYYEVKGVPKSEQKFGMQIYANNYKGLGFRIFKSLNADRAVKNWIGKSLSAELYYDTQKGVGFDPSFSLASDQEKKRNGEFNLGIKINSREGLQGVNFAYKLSSKTSRGVTWPSGESGTNIGFNTNGMTNSASVLMNFSSSPSQVRIPTKTYTFPFNLRFGSVKPAFPQFEAGKFPETVSGFFSTTKVLDNGMTSTPAIGYLNDKGKGGNSSNDYEQCLKDFSRDDIPYYSASPNLSPSSNNYDVFMQSGQGTGGMFRPYQARVGVFSDRISESKQVSPELTVEFANTAPNLVDPSGNPISDNSYTAGGVHVGLGFTYGTGKSYSGPWRGTKRNNPDDLSAGLKDLYSANNTPKDPAFQSCYMQIAGEKAAIMDNEDQLKLWSGDKASRIKLVKEHSFLGWFNSYYKTTDDLLFNEKASTSAGTVSVSNKYRNNGNRIRRGNNIEYLTTDQAKQYGYSKNVKYIQGGAGLYRDKFASVQNVNYKNHHISEVSVLQTDGMRYVYGLPAYNATQTQALFSVTDFGPDGKNLVEVPSANGNIDVTSNGPSPDNLPNKEQFLDQTTLPAYAHSWLLTHVLSSDYIDLTGNGPSDDDYGYWVKFNYEKKANNFKWRVPYEKADFLPGQNSKDDDNKASFTYGEKEMYYLESVETKTHIAKFILSERKDGVAASDFINGGKPTTISSDSRMYKIDKIELYSKNDISQTPVKTVNFKYSYELCPGVPNNSGGSIDENGLTAGPDVNQLRGKLTLKKLFFTYQLSSKGEHNKYEFNYGDVNNTTNNPVYHPLDIDRWGNYKNNHSRYGVTVYDYKDFPYTEQDQNFALTGNAAAPWHLKKIELPNGGTMNIDYEQDDYAYVEGEKAMRMYDIVGLGQGGLNNLNASKRDVLKQQGYAFAQTELGGVGNNPVKVYFKLDKPYPGSLNGIDADEKFKKEYLPSNNKMYFKVLSSLIAGVHYDYVDGYATLDASHSGVVKSGGSVSSDYDFGYITMNKEDLNEINITGIKLSPFTKAAIQHLRVERTDLLGDFLPDQKSGNALQKALKTLGSFITSAITSMTEVFKMAFGFNAYALALDPEKKIILNGQSVIRLNDADGHKYGGGVRVKKLSINDNWENTGVSDHSLYGQEYEYTLEGSTISSGVAYEPYVGSDENALTQPNGFKDKNLFNPTSNLFVQKPVLKNYYPAANVGYSRVVVKSIAPKMAELDNNVINKSASPISINEFYTPKDFPVVTDETDINQEDPIWRLIPIPGFYTKFKRRIARSQGYSVVLNDMAGKLKTITNRTLPSSINPKGDIISQQTYVYNTKQQGSQQYQELSNKVQVLTSDGSYQTATLGQSHDIHIDMNENFENSRSFGVDGNFDCGPSPAYLPTSFMFLKYVSETEASLRTVVVNKIIQRCGILKETIVSDGQSTIKTENIAFDPYTGEPLVTKTSNEFNDPIYNHSYPAYWYYTRTGAAYQNYGVTFTGAMTAGNDGRLILNTSNMPSSKTAKDYFTTGDQVYIDFTSGSPDKVYTVWAVGANNSNQYIMCIDESGTIVKNADANYIRVVKSGYKNLLTTKVGAIAAKESNVIPFNNQDATSNKPTATAYSTPTKIINASAVELKDEWAVFQQLPGSTTTETGCNCYPTTGADELMEFLNKLAEEHAFVGTETLLDNQGNYYHGYSSVLHSKLNFSTIQTPVVLTTTLSGSLFSSFDCVGTITAGTTSLNFTISSIPTPLLNSTWSNVLRFENFKVVKTTTECAPGYYTVDAIISDGGLEKVLSMTIQINRAVFGACKEVQNVTGYTCTDLFSIKDVNPYNIGMKGIFRPEKSYTYVSDRTQTAGIPKVKEDGVFTDFTLFPWNKPTQNKGKWIETNTMTKYSPFGFELENKDAIGNYSAATYGYSNSLVTAIGSNTKYNEIGFDGFEDYPSDCAGSHFRFNAANVFRNVAHTGSHSYKVQGTSSSSVSFTLGQGATEGYPQLPDLESADPSANITGNTAHTIVKNDLIGSFSPIPGKKYVINLWAKEGNAPNTLVDKYSNAKVTLRFYSGNLAIGGPVICTTNTNENVIEGWQRIYSEFDVPLTTDRIEISFSGNANFPIYYDDLRIHPYDGNMVSYVYDKLTYKVLAELDANNFATFYIYDDEGKLIKIKKETANGIVTVKDGKASPVFK